VITAPKRLAVGVNKIISVVENQIIFLDLKYVVWRRYDNEQNVHLNFKSYHITSRITAQKRLTVGENEKCS
jgi:hypothetical protein